MSGRRFWTATAALTIAAFALRAFGASRFVVDLDELLQFFVACRPHSARELTPLLRTMPLHAVLDPALTFLMARVSRELWWLRLQPILLGTACVPMLVALARRFDDETALVSGALLAASVHHVEFSGFVDFYPFLVLWSLAATFLLLRACDDGSPQRFAAYAAALAGFLYTHPWAVLVAGIHGLWIVLRKPERARAFLLSCLAAGLTYLPWFLTASSRLLGDPRFQYHFAQRLPPVEAWRTFLSWAGLPERTMYDMAPFEPWIRAAAPLYAALAALGTWTLTRARRWDSEWILAAMMALGGAAAVVAVDRTFSYDYSPRQALFAYPFFLPFVAEGLRSLRGLLPPRAGRAAVAAVLLTLGFLSLGTLRELSRQLSGMESGAVAQAARLRAAAGTTRTFLFDEPNQAAVVLFNLDRAALLRLDPPRLHDGFYIFGMPPDLTAAGRPVRVIWDPDSTEEQETSRWESLAGDIRAGVITPATSDFGFMRTVPYLKAVQFRDLHPGAFARVRRP